MDVMSPLANVVQLLGGGGQLSLSKAESLMGDQRQGTSNSYRDPKFRNNKIGGIRSTPPAPDQCCFSGFISVHFPDFHYVGSEGIPQQGTEMGGGSEFKSQGSQGEEHHKERACQSSQLS